MMWLHGCDGSVFLKTIFIHKVMKWCFVILVVMTIVSCRCPKPAAEKEYHYEYIETIRDSLVSIPMDESWIKALLECDSIGQVHLKALLDYQSGKHIQPPKVVVKDNIMTVTAEVDSFSIYLKWKEKYVREQEKDTITQIEYEKVRGFFWWIGLICSIVIIVFAGIKTYQAKPNVLIKRIFKQF